jgi:ParB family transcriptional regulator, chromosome partitioning protein
VAIKLGDALRQMKAGIADLDGMDLETTPTSPSFRIAVPQDRQSSTTVLKLEEIIVADRIRRYLDSEKTELLSASIQRYGFRGVLWVRLINGKYHLIAGGRRYAACQQAGISEVAVEVWDVNDAEALQLELLENFQREDLNPIEETEGILRMLEVSLEMSRSEVIGLFNWRARQQRLQGKSSSADTGVRRSKAEIDESRYEDHWQSVEEVFKLIGKLSPEAFRTHRLPLLNLPAALLEAVRSGQLEYSKARLIDRVKDPSARDHLLSKAIRTSMSRENITQIVHQLNESYRAKNIGENNSAEVLKQQLQIRATQVAKSFKTRLTYLSPKQQAKAEKLLTQLEELLVIQE